MGEVSDVRYYVVEWIHSFSDEPVRIYGELDEDRRELRKLEVFREGRVGFATKEIEVGGTALAWEPWPSPEEIGAEPEFRAREIGREEFERVWRESVDSRAQGAL